MKRIKFQTLAKLGTCMLLILLLVKVFIGEWVYIPSDSMFPTISAKSLVWNSKNYIRGFNASANCRNTCTQFTLSDTSRSQS